MSTIEKALKKAEKQRDKTGSDTAFVKNLLEESQFVFPVSKKDKLSTVNIITIVLISLILFSSFFVIGGIVFVGLDFDDRYNAILSKINAGSSAIYKDPFSSDTLLKDIESLTSQNPSNSFIYNGWEVFKSSGFSAAEKFWGEKILNVDPNKDIYLVSAYLKDEGAERRLKMLGPKYNAFSVYGNYDKSMAHYIFILPPKENMDEILEGVKKILSVENLIKDKVGPVLSSIGIDKGSNAVAEGSIIVDEDQNDADSLTTLDDTANSPSVETRRDRFLRDKGTLPPDLIVSARSLVRLGKYKEAVNKLEPLFSEYRTNWEISFVLGLAYIGLGDLDKASDYLQWGLSLDNRQPSLWLELGLVAQQRGNHGEALLYLSEARRLDKKSPHVWLNIGYSNEMLDKKFEAIDAYKQFLSYSSDNNIYAKVRKDVIDRIGELEKQIYKKENASKRKIGNSDTDRS